MDRFHQVTYIKKSVCCITANSIGLAFSNVLASMHDGCGHATLFQVLAPTPMGATSTAACWLRLKLSIHMGVVKWVVLVRGRLQTKGQHGTALASQSLARTSNSVTPFSTPFSTSRPPASRTPPPSHHPPGSLCSGPHNSLGVSSGNGREGRSRKG